MTGAKDLVVSLTRTDGLEIFNEPEFVEAVIIAAHVLRDLLEKNFDFAETRELVDGKNKHQADVYARIREAMLFRGVRLPFIRTTH